MARVGSTGLMDEQLLRDTPWHIRPGEEAVEALGVDPERGLSTDEAAARLERFGRNAIEGSEGDPWWRILLRQFMDPLIYILIAAGLLVLTVTIWAGPSHSIEGVNWTHLLRAPLLATGGGLLVGGGAWMLWSLALRQDGARADQRVAELSLRQG